MLSLGTRLAGRYLIGAVLGEGGMGAVYRAQVEGDPERLVAIKEMTLTGDNRREREQAVAQFRQEAEFLARLDHPNLVKLIDLFEASGRYYLVMDYVDGQSLGDQLEAGQSFSMIAVLRWARQLCSVLDYLHSREPPVLYRDLKPSNILLDREGRLRLVDFGIARTYDAGDSTCTFLQGVGSPGYAPLEQYGKAGSTDHRSDIYSLGATIYHLLTGQKPPSPVELVSEKRLLQSPRRHNPSIPALLERSILRMMGLHKEDRYPEVKQVAYVLEEVLRELEEGGTVPMGSGPMAMATTMAARSSVVSPATPRPEPESVETPDSVGSVRNRLGAALLLVCALVALGFLGLWVRWVGLKVAPTPSDLDRVVTVDQLDPWFKSSEPDPGRGVVEARDYLFGERRVVYRYQGTLGDQPLFLQCTLIEPAGGDRYDSLSARLPQAGYELEQRFLESPGVEEVRDVLRDGQGQGHLVRLKTTRHQGEVLLLGVYFARDKALLKFLAPSLDG